MEYYKFGLLYIWITIHQLTMSTELEKVLYLEEAGLNKDNEIQRILDVYEKDYFAVLDIAVEDVLNISPEELLKSVKKVYRKKTLLIHPDKTTNPSAPVAFARLKKAELILSTPLDNEDDTKTEKKRLLDIYQACKSAADIRKEVSKILKSEIKQDEIEVLYQQRQDAQRFAEMKKQRQEAELKKKLESTWEDARDVRVQNWREYTGKVQKKKKKTKNNVLA